MNRCLGSQRPVSHSSFSRIAIMAAHAYRQRKYYGFTTFGAGRLYEVEQSFNIIFNLLMECMLLMSKPNFYAIFWWCH